MIESVDNRVTDFEGVAEPRPDGQLTLALDGWEGPLDLLLMLARSQKVDLREISILALVEQYLAFIEDAKALDHRQREPDSYPSPNKKPWPGTR